MKVLVECEESQAVCKAFREGGHEAYSCDIEKCSGGHFEWHLQMDAFDAIPIMDWDLIIGFPPCTHLAVSGAVWFEQKRKDGRQQKGIQFFEDLWFISIATGAKVAFENPIGIMSSYLRKPDQIIHPYLFGHLERKATCLWLHNLPLLIETNNVYEEMMKLPKNKRERLHYLPPSKDRAKIRSKTFPGIARAMADQWG